MRKHLDRAILLVAIVVLGWLFYRNAMVASRVVDQTRYFLLDDDMMISMRYARNLADGVGLVWNEGERVEGYTNFLWTLVMAAVHLGHPADATAAIPVRVIGFGFLSLQCVLAVRLLRVFAPRSWVATPLLLATMLTCGDVLLWSVWGFESALLGFLVLAFLVSICERRWVFLGYVALALMPLTRGDGIYVFLACGGFALYVSRRWQRTLVALVLAFLPAIGHVTWRHWYYGEWFPNTYYLKVYLLDNPIERGTSYAKNFLVHYAPLLFLASGSALAVALRDRRGAAFFFLVLSTLVWVSRVGGDMFNYCRFFAHVMPVVFVFATAGIATCVRRDLAKAVWAGVLFTISFPLTKPYDRLVQHDGNGDPFDQIEVAMIIKKNAKPTSSVAVIAAGIVPYFTHLRAIDVLGKSDKYIARLAPVPGAMVGHGKQDARYTLLERRPDIVVSCRAQSFTKDLMVDNPSTDPVLRFLSSRPFQDVYKPNPITEGFTLSRTALYTYPDSPEAAQKKWKGVYIHP